MCPLNYANQILTALVVVDHFIPSPPHLTDLVLQYVKLSTAIFYHRMLTDAYHFIARYYKMYARYSCSVVRALSEISFLTLLLIFSLFNCKFRLTIIFMVSNYNENLGVDFIDIFYCIYNHV